MTSTLTDRYGATATGVLMTGVQALVRLPFDIRRADVARGMNTAVFISGYEGSPLGGYDLELQRQRTLLGELDVVFRPAVNEELAATSVQGTQFVPQREGARVEGVTGFWYGKSPGVDRAADALRHANLMGTHPSGGAVALVGDDPSAKSSTVPGASEWLLADLGMPVLYPADPQHVLDLGIHAVAMSRFSGLWVALKIVTNVADGAARVQVDQQVTPQVPELTRRGMPFPFRHEPNARMLQPTLSELESSRDGIRLDAARAYARANRLNVVEQLGSSTGRPKLGLIAAGKTYLDLRDALRMVGLDGTRNDKPGAPDVPGVRLLRLGMISPLVPEEISEFADGLDEIIVVEEKRDFIESAIKQLLYGVGHTPRVVGKATPDGTPLFPRSGELDADTIASTLRRYLSTSSLVDISGPAPRSNGRNPLSLPVISRTPYFCSGCPHNSSTKVPEGSVVGAGIGCHTLVLMMQDGTAGDVLGLTQMGGEGAQWIGMAPFLERGAHLLQNIGDGTFHHSGSLAIRAAIASGVDVTYKLLYNSAVAMTGGQQAVGAMSVPELTAMLTAEGVQRIIVTTENPKRYRRTKLAGPTQVWHRDRLLEAQEELSKVAGVTVLIHDQECATELRRRRKRGLAEDPAQHVMINERVCEGCGDCGQKSNCLSVRPIETEFGRKTQIDQSSCNKDYSCLKGDCPSFLTVVPAARPNRAERRRARSEAPAPLSADQFEEPTSIFDLETGVHTTRITGVGGSGIVTLSQVLAAAALAAGLEVRTLDQTGLAQKGGAVVSDIKIGARSGEQSNKAVDGECDLYLGCDLLVAGDPRQLAAVDPARTRAVVSTSHVPTGLMVIDPTVGFPDTAATLDRICEVTVGAEAHFVDARAVSHAFFDSDQFANMFLTGLAFQTGALPLPSEAIEEAITLNGVQVAQNVQAFRRGRQYLAAPAAFKASLETVTPSTIRENSSAATDELVALVGARPGSELERLLAVRVPDLVAYQDMTYARRYAEFVARVFAVEQSDNRTTTMTETVARHLYKLMAYKDEYEVARLSLLLETEAAVRAQFGPGARVSYRLHPPILRALGLRTKVSLGPWFRPALIVLRALRVLRGTPLDFFGYSEVRRTERELVGEYRVMIEKALALMTPGNHARCVELASLPDMIRGYEDIKLANVRAYRTRAAEVWEHLAAAQTGGSR